MTPADIAFAILMAHRSGATKLNRRCGQFLGQLVADDTNPLSEAQLKWLGQLADRAGVGVGHE